MSESSFKLVVQLTNSDWKIFEGWRGVAEHKRVGKAQGAALKNFPSPSKTGFWFCQRLIQYPRWLIWFLKPIRQNVYGYNGQLHGKTNVTKLGSFTWQSPSHGKTQRDILGKTHGTIQGSITWQNPLNGKSHWDIHGKNHGTKIVILDVGWRQRQYTFWTAIMIFWGLIHTSLWISLDKNGLFGKVRVFEGKHSQDWAEIAENEEICDLHDKNGGLRFFWQLVQLNYALVSQMGCLERFIFENGQPMTTPPPKVSFWTFRLTV